MKTMKIENSTQIKLFIKVGHWDALKMVPGRGFEQISKKYEKNTSIRNSMVFDSPKPFKSIEKQIIFLNLWSFPKKI